MSGVIKTNVLAQLLKYDKTAVLMTPVKVMKLEDNEDRKDSKYVYEIVKGRYVLKGRKMHLPLTSENFVREKYSEAFEILIFICQEYYSTRIASLFCPHFVKVIAIDTQVFSYAPLPVAVSSAYSKESRPQHGPGITVYTEMVFEMGGTSLIEPEVPRDFMSVYNIMRQTAGAMDTLHSAGISHLDLKPGNILYDAEKDLVKIIDMGESNLQPSASVMGRPVSTLAGLVRGITEQYAAPEHLQAFNGNSVDDKRSYSIAMEDIYSYAMTFYTFITRKKRTELSEIQKMRTKEGASYTKFLDQVKDDVDAVKCNDEMEKSIKKFVVGLLEQCLRFNPSSRPSFAVILSDMTRFEKNANIKLRYFDTCAEYAKKVAGRWFFNKDTNQELLKELSEAKEEIAKLNKTVEKERLEKDKLLQTIEDLRISLDNAVIRMDSIYLAPTEESKFTMPSKDADPAKFKGDLMKVMETALRELQAKMKDKTEYQNTMHCKTCADESSCPVKLSCGHSVCLGCATKRVERTGTMDLGSILCYKCRPKISIFYGAKLR